MKGEDARQVVVAAVDALAEPLRVRVQQLVVDEPLLHAPRARGKTRSNSSCWAQTREQNNRPDPQLFPKNPHRSRRPGYRMHTGMIHAPST